MLFWNKISHSLRKNTIKEKIRNNLFFFGLISSFWLIFRTGTKPYRITYPCQQAAICNLTFSLNASIPIKLSVSFLTTIKSLLHRSMPFFLTILLFGVIGGGIMMRTSTPKPFQEIQLSLESHQVAVNPASDIYVVNGRVAAHIEELIKLMSSNSFFFYRSTTDGENQGPDGLIARNDVVLLKTNSQWSQRGGTNTDLLKELIEAIISHPDGFIGEIVVADNGQGRGNLDYSENNAENKTQSTQDVVDLFSSSYNVSTYDWQKIMYTTVEEYSEGDTNDGYIVYENADAETGIYVSYPKFETDFGTLISFKYGIWNVSDYENRLKVINIPVLKTHFVYGVTGAIKNYMGVQSEKLANGHSKVATGGMGTLMVECGLPTLNIIDAIWVNANPYPQTITGPPTSYKSATRVNIIMSGVDPIALDTWASQNVLVETASSIGYTDSQIQSIKLDNSKRNGLDEAFGVWLNLSKDEIARNGDNVTVDEKNMNVHLYQNHTILDSTSTSSYTTSKIPGFNIILVISSFIILITIIRKSKKEFSKNFTI